MRKIPTRAGVLTAFFFTVTIFGSLVVIQGSASASTVRVACQNLDTDATTIQNAINSSAVHSEIVIQGPCLINKTIMLKGSRSYRGESETTTLTQASGANLQALLASDSWVDNYAFTGEPIHVSMMTLDGNRANNTAATNGVNLRSWRSTVSDVTMYHLGGSGLVVTSISQNGTPFSGNNKQVNGTIRNLFIQDVGQYGIYAQDSIGGTEYNTVTDFTLRDSWISTTGKDAIRLENAGGWNVEGNHVYAVGGSGIWAHRAFGTTIVNNYIEDFNAPGVGIGMTVQGDNVGSVISNNKVFRLKGKGTTFIQINKVNYGTGAVAVTGNVVRGDSAAGTVGLDYQGGGNTLRVTSTGNNVFGVVTPRQGVAPVASY